ncbi:MAG: DUF421 domain-containing protein [Clostridiales bacterium]|nr:DUF421 domain-containing protein [Clostridiales bacterium]
MDIIKVILTTVLSVVTLFIIAKIMGHRQVAQLDFFDYITGITIGSVAAELATELEDPWKPLIAMVIYGAASVGLNLITNKIPKARKYINGSPLVLMNNGKLYKKNLKKVKLDADEFLMMCRELGYFDLNDVQTAIFEANGKLTILPVSTNRPVTPSDLNLNPSSDSVSVDIIMDGRIIDENLKRMGLDINWLDKQLKEQGYNNAKEIFLGVCDRNNKLSLFAAE